MKLHLRTMFLLGVVAIVIVLLFVPLYMRYVLREHGGEFLFHTSVITLMNSPLILFQLILMFLSLVAAFTYRSFRRQMLWARISLVFSILVVGASFLIRPVFANEFEVTLGKVYSEFSWGLFLQLFEPAFLILAAYTIKRDESPSRSSNELP